MAAAGYAVPVMKSIWQLEELQLRQARAFVNGWCVFPVSPIKSLKFQLRDASGNLVGQFPLSAGNPRPDVEHAHKTYALPLYSGFIGFGSWPREPRASDLLVLNGTLADGSTVEHVIPSERFHGLLAPSRFQRKKAAFLQLLGYGKRALLMLRSGQLKSLYVKLQRQLGGTPQRPLPPVLTWPALIDLGAKPEAPIQLVVDHRLGGGANHYRERLVQRWLEEGSVVLTLTYHLAKLQPMLVVETGQQQTRFGLHHESDLIEALGDFPIQSITYNTAVSFAEAEEIPGLLLKLRTKHQSSLTVLLHDFFAICPSHFLIHADGHFCGIPDLATCRDCLPRNPHGFTSLYPGDVGQWRQAWGPLLQQADELIAFSQSTADLLSKAYETWPDGTNWLAGRSIVVRPHQVDYLRSTRIQIRQTKKLMIGIVGQIGFHKGAEVVRALAEEIQRNNAEDRICVIGSLETSVNPKIVKQSGPYNHERLAALIEESGANVMLFPSIWPETFSYVTQEIIELDLPLACFDMGAQAERVKKYSKGLILKSDDPGSILNDLRDLLKRSYSIH